MNPPTLPDIEADVGSYIAGVSNALEGAVAELAAAIFDTPDILHGMIQNGVFFAPGGSGQLETANSFDVSQRVQEYVFANALPMVWCEWSISAPSCGEDGVADKTPATGTSQKIAFIA